MSTENRASTSYSGFIKRALALLIDSVTLSLIVVVGFGGFFTIIAQASSSPQSPSSQTGAIQGLQLLTFFGGFLYYPLFESSSYQATPGKMAIGARVTDLEGQPIGFPKALLRHAGKLLSVLILNIGFLMAGFTEKKQALHDKIAGCLVVDQSS